MRQTSSESPRRLPCDAAEVAPSLAISRAHSVWRERLIAGVAAGTLMLCWFLFFDGLTMRNPWHAVERTGGALAWVFMGAGGAPSLATSLVFFSVLHYGVWIATASFVLGVVHRAKKHPTIVLPALLLSVIISVPLIGVITMLVQLGWGNGSWVRFMIGALIGAGTVAVQAYRAHPGLVRYELAHLDDEEG